MTWIFSLLTSIPGFLNGLLAYLQKRADADVAKNTNASTVDTAAIQAEVARTQAVATVLQAAMGHPVFWIAWSIGVFPVMIYYASILFVSTFPFWGWTVLAAPADAIAFAHQITNWMFGIAGASSLVAGIAQAWAKRV